MASTGPERHIIVVGAGPGGLTAAMILARRGHRVTVVEAAEVVGGRNATMRVGPYVFDVGPSFLMLKEVLDDAFRDAGAETDNLMDMRRLEPMYRLQFAGKRLEPTTDPEGMKAEIERCFPGLGSRYDEFARVERRRFDHLFPCLEKPYHKISTLFSGQLLAAVPHLALGRSLVVPPESIVEVHVATAEGAVLSVDGQEDIELLERTRVTVSVSEHIARFARFRSEAFFYSDLAERLETQLSSVISRRD